MTKKEMLIEIMKYVPSASQTLSKNPSQYVIGISPILAEKAKGCYFWDNEGKKYLDFVLALGPMILGYADRRVDQAVIKQIKKGTIFSVPSESEYRLAKLLSEVVPCAEMSRFLLNGNDATSGAIRLARHITKRDHIAKCGYHGWQDWSICNKPGRNTGVPEIVKTLTHEFNYNNPASLEKIFNDYPDKIAAVILEPVSSEKPVNDFLSRVKEIAQAHGAILIFDELVTGFRWAMGGAQEYFKVVPDIACFGKAICNGYPLAVISGKRELMQKMDEVFVSMTFGGFAPSLVAAIETISIMRETKDFHQRIHALGEQLINEGNKICQQENLPVEFVGNGPHPVMKINISDDHTNRLVKTYIYQEMHKAGIFFSTSLMISYSHTEKEINKAMKRFQRIGNTLSKIKDFNKLEDKLEGDIVSPRTVRLVQ